jgi:hypothetical protein
MSENLAELKLQLAIERGFIPKNATEIQQAIGLETMHQAPLSALGEYALMQTVNSAE